MDKSSQSTFIYPTHTCFDDAIDFLVHEFKNNKELATKLGYKLVHGICLMPTTSEPYSHAWIETVTGTAIESGFFDGQKIYCEYSTEEFYQERKVQELTRYSIHEVIEMNEKHLTYGPWKSIYKRLCKNPELH